MTEEPPRLAPDAPLPPYAYLPGRDPHPRRDPTGHMHGAPEPQPGCPRPEDWRDCGPYLHGLDLFNRGFYWEAHEAWEPLWAGCRGRDEQHAFLQGLIALAAAGFKAREGTAAGVAAHGERAARLFEDAGPPDARMMGFALGELVALAEAIPGEAERLAGAHAGRDGPVFGFVLVPG